MEELLECKFSGQTLQLAELLVVRVGHQVSRLFLAHLHDLQWLLLRSLAVRSAEALLLLQTVDIVAHDQLLVRRVRVLQWREDSIVVLVLCQDLLGPLERVSLLVHVYGMLPEGDVKLADDDLVIEEFEVLLECVVLALVQDADDLAEIVSLDRVPLFVLDDVDEVAEALANAHLLELELDLEALVIFWLLQSSSDENGSRCRQSSRRLKCVALAAAWRLDFRCKLLDLLLGAVGLFPHCPC